MWSLTTAVLLLCLQNPDNTAEGMKALEAHNYEVAAQWFSKAVEADPGDYAARFHLALVQSLTGKDAEAAAGYRKVLELKPGLYQAELNLGMILLRQKQAGEALPHLEAAAGQKPKEFRPQLYLGDALYQTGEFARAAQAYESALAIDPASAAAELGLARAEARQNRLQDAEPHFRKAAQLDPGFRDGLLELAELCQKSGRREDAIALYRQFPEMPAARERAAQLLLEAGRPADAIAELERAVQQSPTAANRLALAQAYRKNNEPEKVISVLEQAVQAEPDNIDLRMAFGRELRDQKKFAPAAQQFSRVVAARPDFLPGWNELAAMLISLEDYPHALAALDRIRAMGGETPGHLYLRAIVLDKVRDLKGALASYQQFLASDGGKNPNEEFKARQRARIIDHELNKR